MGYRAERKRGNRTYLYYITYNDGVRKEHCCGPVGDKETVKKADDIELGDLKFQRRAIDERMAEIRRATRRI